MNSELALYLNVTLLVISGIRLSKIIKLTVLHTQFQV